jgi:tRNA-Thr(GGU) m(6)t(6)A37 methyltransferase TsaA
MTSRILRRLRERGRPEPFPALPPIPIAPIGWVRNDVDDPDRHDWSRVRSRLVLRPDLVPALAGLEGFSHLIVVCWLDRVAEDGRALRSVHPAGDATLPARGVLALRTHHRPNPIGVSAVALEGIDGDTLVVRGLDAADRTPILDLKPYVPHYDSLPDARLPDWALGV